jgi:hypothetical protein
MLRELLFYDVAEKATLLQLKITQKLPQFVRHTPRDEGRSGYLRVRVFEVLTGVLALVAKEGDITEPPVFFKVHDS